MKKIVEFFTSLKLVIVTLSVAIIVIFAGTLAQARKGTFTVKAEYFDSLFIYADLGEMQIPVFPGGFLICLVLVVSLTLSMFVRFKWKWKNTGILLSHAGLILLIIGTMLTSFMQVESNMPINVGEEKFYASDYFDTELAVLYAEDDKTDNVISIPDELLAADKAFIFDDLSLELRIKRFLPDSDVFDVGQSKGPAASTKGLGQRLTLVPAETNRDEKLVATVVEVLHEGQSLGTWLLSNGIEQEQAISIDGKEYRLALRHTRYYTPYSITLKDRRHDLYPGTMIPKNFSSTITLKDPRRDLESEAKIKMNEPFSYGGNTYYQKQFPTESSVVYMVVKNPSWRIPYIACLVISLGLVVQFVKHLLRFHKRRSTS